MRRTYSIFLFLCPPTLPTSLQSLLAWFLHNYQHLHSIFIPTHTNQSSILPQSFIHHLLIQDEKEHKSQTCTAYYQPASKYTSSNK